LFVIIFFFFKKHHKKNLINKKIMITKIGEIFIRSQDVKMNLRYYQCYFGKIIISRSKFQIV